MRITLLLRCLIALSTLGTGSALAQQTYGVAEFRNIMVPITCPLRVRR
jgi:hypothetical protein